jgi:hypothetical protein
VQPQTACLLNRSKESNRSDAHLLKQLTSMLRFEATHPSLPDLLQTEMPDNSALQQFELFQASGANAQTHAGAPFHDSPLLHERQPLGLSTVPKHILILGHHALETT